MTPDAPPTFAPGVPHNEASHGLRLFVRIIWTNRWLMIAVAIAVTIAATGYSLHQKKLYQASAQVFLSDANLASELTNTQTSVSALEPQRIAQTQAEIAVAPAVASSTIAALGLHESVDELLQHITVTAEPSADLLDFTVTNESPSLAVKIGDEYPYQYTLFRRQIDTSSITLSEQGVQRSLSQLQASNQQGSSLYQSLESKYDELNTLATLETSNSLVVAKPVDATQVRPTPVRDGILGLVLGIVLGIAVAFLRYTFDTRMRSIDDLRDTLGLPLLGAIPAPPAALTRGNELVMVARPGSAAAEAFRLLRVSIDFANVDRKASVILVTSAIAGEGKTTTASNLAVAMARAGRSVILMDMDLRRPRVHQLLHVDRSPGLTDVVLGSLAVEDALVHVDSETMRSYGGAMPPSFRENMQRDLAVLPAGNVAPNVGEFVGTSAVAHVITRLRKLADMVIIDTPPSLEVSDALMLTKQADAMIVVARLNVLRRPAVVRMRDTVANAPILTLGCVVTDSASDRSYGYGYGYGGDGYFTDTPAADGQAGAVKSPQL